MAILHYILWVWDPDDRCALLPDKILTGRRYIILNRSSHVQRSKSLCFEFEQKFCMWVLSRRGIIILFHFKCGCRAVRPGFANLVRQSNFFHQTYAVLPRYFVTSMNSSREHDCTQNTTFRYHKIGLRYDMDILHRANETCFAHMSNYTLV